MNANIESNTRYDYRHSVSNDHAHSEQLPASAVSWGAILAGAVGAASLSLILLVLGTGLGLASVSPWVHDGISKTTFGVGTIIWVTFTQLAAAGLGGYLAGRLRTRWLNTQGDEVYFRDTAHGFLAWAVATLLTAGLLTSVIASVIGTGVESTATVVAGVASKPGSAIDENNSEAISSNTTSYFIDNLLRPGNRMVDPNADGFENIVNSPAPRREVSRQRVDEINRVIVHAAGASALPAQDVKYLGSIISERNGITQTKAEQQVATMYSNLQAELRNAEAAAKAAADEARKASAYAALWLFVSLLSGAFVASWLATFGGRQRDA